MKKMKHMLVFLFFTIISFYLLPFLAFKMGGTFIFSLIAIPLVTFALSMMYSVINGFYLVYSIVTGAAFVPVPMIFFHLSNILSLKLGILILIIALLGNVIGTLICFVIHRIYKIPGNAVKKMG